MGQNQDAEVHPTRDSETLQVAFGREGCPVCNVMLDAMNLYMDSWQYEGFTDVEHRHHLIASRGFCPLHTWQLAQRPTAFPLALVYREVLTDVLATIKHDREGNKGAGQSSARHGLPWTPWGKGGQAAANDVEPQFHLCPFCQLRTKVEERLMQTLVEQLTREDVRTGFSQSTGLCLLHFTMAREYARQSYPHQLPALLDCQETCMQRVLAELQELIRKHDYRFENESDGPEMESWRRGAELCAGNPGVR